MEDIPDADAGNPKIILRVAGPGLASTFEEIRVGNDSDVSDLLF